MQRISVIARREVASLFFSPIAYLVMFLFLLVEGFLFGMMVFVPGNLTELRMVVSFSQFGLFFIIPLMTMSLFSEEYRSGRIEMLRTSPITELDLVLGKFAGAMIFYIVLLGLTFIYLGLLVIFGRPDWGQTFSSYLGLLLLGTMYVSVGLFFSACTQAQIVAAMASFLTLGFFTFAQPLSGFLPQNWGVFGQVKVPVRAIFRYLGSGSHVEDFAKGVFDTQHLVYFGGFTVLFLFMTYLVIESKKWR